MRVLSTVLHGLVWLLLAGGCAPLEKPEEPFWSQELLLRIYLDGLTMIHPELTLEYRLNTPSDQQRILDDIERSEQLVRELDLPPEPLPPGLLAKLDRLMVRRLQDYHQRRESQPSEAELRQYYQEHLEEFPRLASSVEGTPQTEQVPFDQVVRSIQRRLFRERLQKQNAAFYEQAAARHEVEILFEENLSAVPPLDTPVYRLDGRTFTYRDILDTHSNIYGDRASVEFFHSIVKRAMRSELLFLSPEADAIRQSREYQFLQEGFAAQWRVFQFLNGEYETTPITEEELRQFYEEHQDELYRAPPEVKLVVVSVATPPERGPEATPSATEAGAVRENLDRIRKDLIASASPENFSFAAYRHLPGLRTTRLEEWTPVNRLGSSIETDIAGHGPGYTSSILGGRWGYVFYHLLDRRQPRPYRPFSEVQEEIKSHIRNARKRKIRESFGLS